jgi:spermidine synthase
MAVMPMAAHAALPPVTLSEFEGVRYLHLGSEWVQGAMRLRHPQVIELEYVRRLMVWMLWRPSDELARGHAVQLGLGAATVTRFCAQRVGLRCTAVELNAQVIQVCRSHFRLPADSDRLQVVQADAGEWVRLPQHQGVAQVLTVDLYDHEAAAPVLDDAAFYADCHRVLAPGGLMSVNLFGRQASFARSALRIATAFGSDQVWSVQPTKEGNTVVVAARGVAVPDRDTLAARAATIEARFGLPARRWLHMVRPLNLPAGVPGSMR